LTKKLTRNQVRQITEKETTSKDKLKFSTFLKTVLDFQLREHEKFLSRFSQEFRAVDLNNDGVIDEPQFRTLMKRLKVVPVELIEKFLQDIDPFNNQKITFSECVHLLSTEMIRRREDGHEMAVLEAIAAMGSAGDSLYNINQ